MGTVYLTAGKLARLLQLTPPPLILPWLKICGHPLASCLSRCIVMDDMNAAARSAVAAIRESLAAGSYRLTPHFRQRLAERGLLWADVLCVFDAPTSVRPGGAEEFGRPKWIAAGKAADGLAMEIVCVLDRDAHGRWTVFITAYFEV